MLRKFKAMISEKTDRALLKAANWVLFVLVVLVLAAIAIVCVQTICTDGWRLALNADGVKAMQSFWGEYSPMITFGGCCLTLLVANYHLMKYLDVETVKALGKLREMLNTPEKKAIHDSLLPPEDRKHSHAEGAKAEQNAGNKSRPTGPTPAKNPLPAEWSTVELYDYLGTIELGAIMLQRGVISFDEFYNQFGYRVENLSRNAEIIRHVEDNSKYYEMFLFARKEVTKHRTSDK